MNVHGHPYESPQKITPRHLLSEQVSEMPVNTRGHNYAQRRPNIPNCRPQLPGLVFACTCAQVLQQKRKKWCLICLLKMKPKS